MRVLILALACTTWLGAQQIEPMSLRAEDENTLNNVLEWSEKSGLERPKLWRIWLIATEKKTHLAALFVTASIIKPGWSAACLLFFDDLVSKPTRNQCFSTGGRIEPAAARMHYSATFGTHILTLDMSNSVTFEDGHKGFFSDVAKEHFAIGDRGARLIRVEDDDGRAIANRSNIGPAGDNLTAEQLAALLADASPLGVLEVLQLLAGPAGIDFREHAELWTQVNKLATASTHAWVRDAANVALSEKQTPQFAPPR
ncbi:hypothetical protein F183_A15190 [Bryobacterales bacterium F-183]|nr:hypothetical protein F183_A15190 [Bryobacterales bacterium F-183]